MRRSRLFFIFSLVLLISLPVSAERRRHFVEPTGGAGLPRLRLGRTVSLSGVYAEESLAVFNGIRFWFEWLNNNTGGVINTTSGQYAIELLEYNDASDPENVLAFYRDMSFFDNITAAFGPWTTELSIPAIQQTSRDNVPFVFSGGSAPFFYQSGFNHSFGLLVKSGLRSLPCMELYAARKVQTAVIMASTDSFQQTVLTLLAAQAAQLNITVLFNATVDKSGLVDFTEYVDRIRDLSPDVVLCAMETPSFEPFIARLRDLPDGVPSAVYNSNAATVSLVYSNIGWPADQVFGGDQWSPLLANTDPIFESTAGFAQEYRARFNYTPGFVDAASVAAGFAMQWALENAASFAPADIIAALRLYSAPASFFGPVRFLPTGELNATGICTQLLPTPSNETQKSTKDRALFPVAPPNLEVVPAVYPAIPIRPPGPRLSSSQKKLVIALSVVGGVLIIAGLLVAAWFLFRSRFEVVLFPKTKGEDKW